MDKLALIVAMEKPAFEKVEVPPREATIEDSLDNSLPTINGSPMEVDGEQRLEQRPKRSRWYRSLWSLSLCG